MENNSPLDLDPNEQVNTTPLTEAIHWWEKKRLTYNIVILIIGIGSMLLFGIPFHFVNVILIFMYGAVLNVLFCPGYMLESLVFHYSKGLTRTEGWRPVLFALGLLLSMALTFFYASTYSLFF